MSSLPRETWVDQEFFRMLRALLQDQIPIELNEKSGLDRSGPLGETLLHYLVVENCLNEVRVLISMGASIDTKNSFGETPLIDAAKLGHLAMIELLLESGADPLIRSDSEGETALHASVHGMQWRVYDRLSSISGLSEVRNGDGLTAAELRTELRRVRQE